MTPEQHARIKELFLELMDCPAEEQHRRLKDACGDDPDMLRELARLLEHHVQRTLKIKGLLPQEGTASTAGAGAAETTASVLFDEPQPLDSGTMIAERYRVVDLLGQGGMGRVYRVDDVVLHQPVALKFLNPALAGDREWLARFHKEARLARTISHSNVCRVYDIGEFDGVPFISMEYVDGEDLATLLRRIGRVPGDKAVEMAGQICAGLAAAHAHGVLHRDLKPSNIMIDGQGCVRITDFGLAGLPEEIKGLEIRAGTPAYMAPEQIGGQAVSTRSDLYSLGLVLYELFTGQRAIKATSALDYADQHLKTDPAPPSMVLSDIDPSVERVIMRCLEKDPAHRPASALAVAAALPGYDVLAAALAANEIPSPELVAAASVPQRPQLAPTAWLMLCVFLVILLLGMRAARPMPWEAHRVHPAGLEIRARDVIEAAGHALETRPSHTARGYYDADDLFDLAPGFLADESSLRDNNVLQASELLYWYRQSPTAMLPRDFLNVFFGYATITPGDPPPMEPGMVAVAIDASGRLRLFAAVPYLDGGHGDVPATTTTWLTLAEAAGIEMDTLEPLTPQFRTLFTVEESHAWKGLLDGRPVRLQAASAGGQAAFFAVVDAEPPGNPAVGGAGLLARAQTLFLGVHGKSRRENGDLALTVLLVTLLFFAPFWAYRNHRAGRVDSTGALRVAVLFLGLELLVWLLQMRYVTAADQIYYGVVVVIEALGGGTVVWIYYSALEPSARRQWPHMLITWSRALRLRLRDSVVAQHVLVGVALGLIWALLSPVEQTLGHMLGLPSRPILIRDEIVHNLLGGRFAIADCLTALRESLIRGLGFVLLLAWLRAALRVPSLAAMVTAAALGITFMTRATNLWTGVGLFVVIGAGCGVWMTTRYGLVTLVIGLFVSRVLTTMPLGFSSWYNNLTVLALAIVAVLALYGFIVGRRAPSP